MIIDTEKAGIRELHAYFLAAVAPRPIAFASTIDAHGKVNLSPFSYFNVFSTKPPVVIFSPARSGRENKHKHSYENVKEVPEVAISMVTYSMSQQMSLASTAYPKGVNEFVKSGFTPATSKLIKPPMVAESPVSLECTVDQVIELGESAGAGNLIICHVRLIHIKDEFINENGQLDTTKLDLIGRMGGPWYTRASGQSLFQIPKPLRSLGIGVDQLPQHVFGSSVLTGNHLGILGNQDRLPTMDEINDFAHHPLVRNMVVGDPGREEERIQIAHKGVAEIIEQGKPFEALCLVFALDHAM
jgi:flavin reductase (DIM6/NTAB) family NADH-FMN oxidoreductase RutF